MQVQSITAVTFFSRSGPPQLRLTWLRSDPCIGYTFSEVQFPFRKLVILGDTYDPAPILPLCINPSPTLLIHEATDSHISHHADPSGKLSRRTASEVHQKALSRGHSVPEMAGTFAKQVDAQDLVLNHIGGRYTLPIFLFTMHYRSDHYFQIPCTS